MELSFSLHFYFILAAVLLFTNAVCAAGELAVLRCSLEPFEEESTRRRLSSRAACWLLQRVSSSLAVCQLGRSISSILLGWLAYIFFIVLQSSNSSLQVSWVDQQSLAVIVSILATVLSHIVLAEMVAKSISMANPENTLRAFAIPLFLVAQVFRPVIFLVVGLANVILKPFGTSVPETAERMHSASEISRIVTQSTEHGVFDEHEETMFRGVFGFSETVAREVMTPRTDLVAVDIGASLPDILARIEETGFSRFPVSGNGIDDIHGVLLVKDLLSYLAHKSEPEAADFHLSQVMRQAYFIPGTKPIDDLLNEFKSRKLHMAVVLDEHGGVDGLVTLEDLIEEIVGDIYDESDTPELELVEHDNGDVVVDGGMLVTDLNDRLDLEIPEGDYDTIAGFIFTSLGRMPEGGDEVSIADSGEVIAQDDDEDSDNSGPLTLVNGASSSQEEDELEELSEDQVKVVIRVEKVENHRIESVRLIQLENEEVDETTPPIKASQS